MSCANPGRFSLKKSSSFEVSITKIVRNYDFLHNATRLDGVPILELENRESGRTYLPSLRAPEDLLSILIGAKR